MPGKRDSNSPSRTSSVEKPLENPLFTIVLANIYTKAKQAVANLFAAPAYASAVA